MIFYVSKHGTVRQIAGRVAAAAADEAFDLGADAAAASQALQRRAVSEPLVVAAPIYAGSVPRSMLRFLEAERDRLLAGPVAVAVACLYEAEEARIQLAESFPPWLVGHADRQVLLGGRVIMNELRWPVRMLLRRILGHREDVDTLREDAVTELSDWIVTARRTGASADDRR